ncbi:hypothetical protein Tco_0079952 [Tanacetum coccineum]
MKNPNHLNVNTEAIPKINQVVPEPNQVVDIHDPNEMVDIPDNVDLVDYDGDDEENPEEDSEKDPKEEPEPNIGHGDQFAQHPNPQPGNINGWLEEDDDMNENVNDEDIEDEDVKIESSDSVSSDSELEDDKADVAPEDTFGTITQRPYAVSDFLRGVFKATRTLARLIEAEVGTNHTKTAFLDSKIKIGEKERKILDHDLGNVEKTLSNVVERLKILESGENATFKKKLEDTEMQLVIARMDCASAERRLHESIGWNKRFYMEMVCIRTVPKPPSNDEGTERPRNKLKKSSFDGTEGPSEPHGPPSDS